MPLLVITLIGILAFGIFDLTLGRPLPVTVQSAAKQNIDLDLHPPTIDTEVPASLSSVSFAQSQKCEGHDKACGVVALYRFVFETIKAEPIQSQQLHPRQSPHQTLLKKKGDPTDIALLFSALLDQQHIRNYLIMSSQDSYVLACDVSPAGLQHAGEKWQPVSSILNLDPTSAGSAPSNNIDAFSLNVADAPCPCLLLNPSGSRNLQPGDPLPVSASTLRSAIDRVGQRHSLIPSL